jgi:SAM-dependent methyltransferase
LSRIKKTLNWNCVGLEIDKSLSKHAKSIVGIKILNTNFLKMPCKKKFDIITFNKVIEHAKNPIAFIKCSKKHLKKGGFVYIEVPDAESASRDKCGYEREEFTIDHPHIFSLASLSIAVTKSNMKLISLKRIIEPSGKYTLRAFAAIK